MFMLLVCSFFFFFNDTATTEIYTLSLHDALPIFQLSARRRREGSHRDRDAPRLEAKRRDPLVRPPHRQSPQPGRAWHHAAGDRRAVPKLPHRAAPGHPRASRRALGRGPLPDCRLPPRRDSVAAQDRKSTRLNSSHSQISYAVFCLKKKKTEATMASESS